MLAVAKKSDSFRLRSAQPDFLRPPPFPGARDTSLVASDAASLDVDDAIVDGLMNRIAALRIGGSYWGAQPPLPGTSYAVVRIADPQSRADALLRIRGDRPVLVAHAADDPWHLVSGAAEVMVDAGDELALVAALAGVPVRCVGDGSFKPLERGDTAELRNIFRRHVLKQCIDPFTGAACDFAEVVEISGFWRQLIDSNRDIGVAVGFALWKRKTVSPLLWAGTSRVPFASSVPEPKPHHHIAVWKSRTGSRKLAQLETSGARLIEVEDGFIRSAGLGADCIPPLSIVVDRVGIYFDPGRSSELERLLEEGEFPEELLQRARRLREIVVEAGIGKYGLGGTRLERRQTGKRHLLVVGQVEDDRAVIVGGGPRTNIGLLERVREANPDAHLIYKPHPDVEAGHRSGAIAGSICLALADEIAPAVSIASLIDLVDEVHVNTSLAGFEALLRSKPVSAYGVPFYAGWGLTRDLGPVPARRSRSRTVDELVAAALLLYPRYLDPVTRLPCPPEVLVRRLTDSHSGAVAPPLARLRRLQGRWKRNMAALQRAFEW
jgi:capsular polysaccharide export protein